MEGKKKVFPKIGDATEVLDYESELESKSDINFSVFEKHRLKKLGFKKENTIRIKVLTTKSIVLLNLILVGQLIADAIYFVWVGCTHFRDRSEWIVSSTVLFWLTTYSLYHLYFVYCFFRRLTTTRGYNFYLKLLISNYFFLVTEILQLSSFFLVHFSPAGTKQNWETVTLFAISSSRLLASIKIMVSLMCYTKLVDADFNEKKNK